MKNLIVRGMAIGLLLPLPLLFGQNQPATKPAPSEKFQTQFEMNQEAYGDFQKADAEMNDVYKSLIKKLGDDKAAVRKLRAAQRAWVTYRDAEADFVAQQYEGGSMKPTVRSSSLEEVTRKRTDQLKLDLEDRSR